MDVVYFIELAVNGALVGLMYALVALGIVLVFKSSGVANLAQGALAMVGAYVVWWLGSATGAPLWAVIPLGVIAMFFFGRGLERVALRRMVGQPVIMIIMLTLGLEILLRGLAPALWGTLLKRMDIGISQQPLFLGDILVNRAYLVGGAVALVLIALSLLFFNSRQGVVLRAVSDDQIAAWAVGIRVERAISLSWGFAGIAATAAGVLWGSVQGIDWTLSLLLIKALAVAILGGLDSIAGVLVAGIAVGVLESVIPGYVDPLVGGGTRDVVASAVILLTILVRPFGLFGREQIERI
ncbi:MAG: branched-chain amino acid ABC transporter permease [Variibacter sp.]|nr:branched-chain amino acid ABC transporter permease [Variibacter sp.]